MCVIHGASKRAYLRTNGIHEFTVSFWIRHAIDPIVSFHKNGFVGSAKRRF